jgi:nucleoside 2-deoxyribosyltransferase
MPQKLYLAGGLFNAGQRIHNLMLEKALKLLGYAIILPQREALKFFRNDNTFDIDAIVADCRAWCLNPDVICVTCSDGADGDSGACVEHGIATTATGRALVYRTDFRTALANEAGLNAMLRGPETRIVYKPCFFTKLVEVEAFYDSLAADIDAAIKTLTPR